MLAYIIQFVIGFSISRRVSAITTTMPYETFDPAFLQILNEYLPDGYTMEDNIYEWNVTEVVIKLEQSFPGLLYGIETEYLTTLFNDYLLHQLPADLLIAHELYQYLDPSNPLYDDGNGTTNISNSTNGNNTADLSFCPRPFVETRFRSYFDVEVDGESYPCALRCEYTDLIWGNTPAQNQFLDEWVLGCTITFLCLIMLTCTNHGFDIFWTKEKCCLRPLLFHIPIAITCMYSLIVLSLLMSPIFGKDAILCEEDLNGVMTASFNNPQGGSESCSIVGSFFYLCSLGSGVYTSIFSIVLWKNFYSPLSSLAVQCGKTTIGKPFAVVYRFLNSQCWEPLCGLEMFRQFRRSMNHWFRSNDKASSLKTNCCSAAAKVHWMAISMSLLVLFIMYGYQVIDSFSPLGICTVGGRERKYMLWFTVIPYTLVSIIPVTFMPAALILLIKQVRTSAGSEVQRHAMASLGWRLGLYFGCVVMGWTSIALLSWIFYDARYKLLDAATVRLTCFAFSGNFEVCNTGYQLGIGWYVLMILSPLLTALGSVILTCHTKNYNRWMIVLYTVYYRVSCKEDNMAEDKFVDRLRTASSITPSKDRDPSRTGSSRKNKKRVGEKSGTSTRRSTQTGTNTTEHTAASRDIPETIVETSPPPHSHENGVELVVTGGNSPNPDMGSVSPHTHDDSNHSSHSSHGLPLPQKLTAVRSTSELDDALSMSSGEAGHDVGGETRL